MNRYVAQYRTCRANRPTSDTLQTVSTYDAVSLDLNRVLSSLDRYLRRVRRLDCARRFSTRLCRR